MAQASRRCQWKKLDKIEFARGATSGNIREKFTGITASAGDEAI